MAHSFILHKPLYISIYCTIRQSDVYSSFYEKFHLLHLQSNLQWHIAAHYTNWHIIQFTALMAHITNVERNLAKVLYTSSLCIIIILENFRLLHLRSNAYSCTLHKPLQY